MPKLEIENLKALREALCVAEGAIDRAYGQRQSGYKNGQLKQIREVIKQIDILRPLGPNGKHGDLHTEFCGCDDNPYLDALNEWRPIPNFGFYEMSGRGDVRIAGHVSESIKSIIGYKVSTSKKVDNLVCYLLCREEYGNIMVYNRTFDELVKATFPDREVDGTT